MESRRRGAGCSWGRVPQSQGKMEGGKGTSWGCQGDVFRCKDRTVERLLRAAGYVWFLLFVLLHEKPWSKNGLVGAKLNWVWFGKRLTEANQGETG